MRHAHYKLLPHRERARPMVAANFSAVYLQARRRARQVVPFNTPADIAGLKLWLDAGFGTLAAWAVAPASGGFWIDYSPSSGYVASSATHKIRIYPFKTVSGSRVYSASYLELETTDDGSTLFYAINWSWDSVVGAEGYRLLKSDSGNSYNFDYYHDVLTNAWVDATAGALAAGSTVLPQLLSAAGAGDGVTRWSDQSGLGNDATQNNGTARATLQTNVVNGLPVLRFDSDDGYTTPLALNTPCTVFAVYALTGLGDLARRAVQGSNNWLLGPYGPPHEFFNGVSFTGGPALTRAVFVAQAAWQNASVSRNWINGMFVGAALGAGGGPGTVGLGTGGSNFEPLFKAHDAQALQWPRELARDDDALRSVALVALSPRDEFFPSNAVPTALRDATIETARELIKANRADDPQGEGLASMSITGSMSLNFDKRDRAPIIPHVAQAMLTKLGDYLRRNAGVVQLTRT